MQTHWIVLANASLARIGRFDKPGAHWVELFTLVHPESRLTRTELGADRSGHGELGGGAAGHGRSQLAPRTDARHKAHEAFARELAAQLDEAVGAHTCKSWVLLASNPFLGELKAQLGKGALAALQASVPVDLTSLEAHQLHPRVAEVLAQRAG